MDHQMLELEFSTELLDGLRSHLQSAAHVLGVQAPALDGLDVSVEFGPTLRLDGGWRAPSRRATLTCVLPPHWQGRVHDRELDLMVDHSVVVDTAGPAGRPTVVALVGWEIDTDLSAAIPVVRCAETTWENDQPDLFIPDGDEAQRRLAARLGRSDG